MWPRTAHHIGHTYVIGFLFSLVLTLAAYVLAVKHIVSPNLVVPLVLIFACLQFIVQVLNFLHVSGQKSSRNRLITLACTATIMLILVLGSMWIMANLDSRMQISPEQMEMYMSRQRGI